MTALALIARFWRECAIGLLLALCGALVAVNARKADQLRVCQQTRLTDQATWRAASEKARADDLAHAAAVEARNDTISKEQANDLQTKLADARAAAERFRLRAQASADRGASGGTHLSEASATASGVAGAGSPALVPIIADDLDICAVNSAKAEGWRAWFLRVNEASDPAQ